MVSPVDVFSGTRGVDPNASGITHASGKRDSDIEIGPNLISYSALSADSSTPGTNTDQNSSAFFSWSTNNSSA